MPGNGIALPLRHKGLTLIELLVAITILAIIAVLGWRGLDSIVRARIALTSDLEQTRGMQLAFAQLQSDCAHLAGADILPNRMPLQLGQGQLTMVRTVFNYNQPTHLQVVDYRVRDGKLVRRESLQTRDLTVLDTLWQEMQGDVNQAQDGLRSGVVLQSGLNGMQIRLWAGNGWHTGAAASLVKAPTGMEVAIQSQGQEGSLLKVFMLGAG